MKKTKKKTKAKKVAKKACKKCKRGFTLIELLVVVAIIGILAGIVVVSMTSSRQRSVKASLLSTMSSINATASVCVHEDGNVQAPTHVETGGGPICSLTDFSEQWPSLPTQIVNAGYQYNATVSDTQIVATDGTNNVVTCDVGSGSCTLVP